MALVVAGCAAGGPSPSTGVGQIAIVTTTTVLADLAQQVGGELVSVRSLVPKGGEVHTFDPKPSDAVAIAEADLALMNGLGLDDWMQPLVQNTGRPDLPLLKLGEDLSDIEYIAADPAEDEQFNPHLWMDVAYARKYAERITLELDQIDPAHAARYDANAAAYDAKLAELDGYIKGQFAAIPAEQRKIVAFHDAFPYYAQGYRLTIVGVVVDAPGQDPSAGEMADLIAAIRQAQARVILAEVQFPDQLVRQIAAETGAVVVSDLYDDALTDTVPSYEQMMRWDTDRIVEALR